MRISDWSSDVCSSDLLPPPVAVFSVCTAMTPLALPPSADRLESMCRRPPQHGEQVQQHLFAVEIDRFPAVEQATELFPALGPAVRPLPVRQSAPQPGSHREKPPPPGPPALAAR